MNTGHLLLIFVNPDCPRNRRATTHEPDFERPKKYRALCDVTQQSHSLMATQSHPLWMPDFRVVMWPHRLAPSSDFGAVPFIWTCWVCGCIDLLLCDRVTVTQRSHNGHTAVTQSDGHTVTASVDASPLCGRVATQACTQLRFRGCAFHLDVLLVWLRSPFAV